MQEKIDRLRAALKQAQEELIEAEAELADEMAEVTAFEQAFEQRLGGLIDELATIELTLRRYNERMQRHRNKQTMGSDYLSVEDQFRRAWEVPPQKAVTPPPEPVSPADEKQIKRLYRKLARRYHPDLAANDADRAYRTEKMAAVNDAYAARSLAELVAFSEAPDMQILGRVEQGQTATQMVEALEKELKRIRRRMNTIQLELAEIHNRPSVQLSLEVKLAQRRGRDLLQEMEEELKMKVGRKSAERDFLKAQLDQLGPDPDLSRFKRR